VFRINTEEDSRHRDLSRLWELDWTPDQTSLSPENEKVTQHFLDTHSIDHDERYVVKLPWIANPPTLGKSRHMAMRRYLQNERSLTKKGKFDEFHQALKEYKDMEHAEDVPDQEKETVYYYLPVHEVFKQSSTST